MPDLTSSHRAASSSPRAHRLSAVVLLLLPLTLSAYVHTPQPAIRSRALRPRVSGTSMAERYLVGRPAPLFTAEAVYDQEFIEVRLADYGRKRGQYVVLLFYPLDFTFVCPTEITAFSDSYEEFRDLNTQLLAVSVDSKYTHLAWTQTERTLGGVGEVNFPLVSDLTKSISASYGMLVEEEGVAMRGIFIIDPNGFVQHMAVNNLAFGRNPTEVLRILQAIQYTQQHPDELCPAGWRPGESTIPANVIGARQYFAEKAEVAEAA